MRREDVQSHHYLLCEEKVSVWLGGVDGRPTDGTPKAVMQDVANRNIGCQCKKEDRKLGDVPTPTHQIADAASGEPGISQ
jgi:hypothetical protein